MSYLRENTLRLRGIAGIAAILLLPAAAPAPPAPDDPAEPAHPATRPAAKPTRHQSPARPPARPPAATPEAITVTATPRAHLVSGGALGTRSDLDTPFSARVVTAAELADRQVKSLARVFSEDASVVANGDTYSFNSYSQTVRGIPLDDYNSYRINGDPFYMTTVELPLESFEAVQLLKGASGFMYGFNAPGGLINYQTKRPTETRFVGADLGYSSDGVLLQHLDTGGRVLNDVLGYRLNLTHEQGQTYNGSNLRRYSGSLGLDARLGDDLLWTADLIDQDRRIREGTQDFYIDGGNTEYTASRLPRAISGTINLSAYPDLFFNSHVFYGATGLRWTIAPRWTLHVDYSNSRDWRSYKSQWMSLNDVAGNYDVLLDTDPRSWSQYNQVQSVLEGRFDTWGLQHQLTFGASWQQLNKYLPYNDVDQLIGSENLYASIVPVNYPSTFDRSVYHSFHSEQEGVFASDTVSLGPISLLGGLRFTDYFEADYDGQGGRTAYTETPVTPVAALLYHPWRDTTLYVSYVQALQGGVTVPDTYVNARQTLPVVMSDQIEIGAKVERPDWSLSAALYRIDEGAQYPNPATNVYVSNGTQRYDGIEANGRVKLPFGLELVNSIAAEHATYLKAEAGIQDKTVEGVPSLQDSVQLTENFRRIPGFSATAEVHYTIRFWGDDLNTYRIPSTTLLNLRTSYALTVAHHPVVLRAELDNVANLHYWGFLSSDYFFVGPPRTLLLSASVRY